MYIYDQVHLIKIILYAIECYFLNVELLWKCYKLTTAMFMAGAPNNNDINWKVLYAT